jgi:serine O-acetyltransferase
MIFREFQSLVQSDLYRYDGARGIKCFAKNFLLESGFRYCVLLRTCHYFRTVSYLRWGFYHLVKFWFYRLSLVLGVYMDPSTEVGPGFYIGHACGIIINRRCRLGANCTISAHVTLGRKSREPKEGCPTLGDRVYVGPGAVIIGAIHVADDAAVGANAVVTKDVPAKSVAVGIPAVIISDRGSEGYVAWPWQPTN